MCNLKYSIRKEIHVVFLNRSNYDFSKQIDYHFIIKEVAKKFKGEFNCVKENTEKQ